MTKPRDPEALLSAYLAEGMEVLPDRVADAVLDEVHRTRQRAVFGRWRTRSISRVAFAAVAVVADGRTRWCVLRDPAWPARVRRSGSVGQCERQRERARRRWAERDAHGNAQPDASCRSLVEPGEPGRGLAGAGQSRARRWCDGSCRSSGRKTGKRAAIKIPPTTPSPMTSRGSTSTRCRSAITVSARSSGSQGRRTWIRPSSGWHTASSRMTTATALRTGGSGSTTSQGP